jgi:pimeloyl-ACP methyl ester carboxylesterase
VRVERTWVTTSEGRLEACVWEPEHARSAAVLLLHEGLGSLDLWRGFPEALASGTRRCVAAYSRLGYGRSDPRRSPYAPDYLFHEATVVLPEVIAQLRLSKPVLAGHSDGASIALIAAIDGSPIGEHRLNPITPSALVLMAPHTFVEPFGLAGIREARERYWHGPLRAALGRHHDDVDSTFLLWNDIWLDPDFWNWDIRAQLDRITCPVLVLQGDADAYGSIAHAVSIAERVRGRSEVAVLTGTGHSPARERPQESLAAITRFLGDLD